MTAIDLLKAAKAAAGVSSDYGLAKVLQVSRFAISGYVCGRTLPDPLVCFRIARLIGQEPARVVALVELERAQRKGDDTLSTAWREELEALPLGKPPAVAADDAQLTLMSTRRPPRRERAARAALERALSANASTRRIVSECDCAQA